MAAAERRCLIQILSSSDMGTRISMTIADSTKANLFTRCGSSKLRKKAEGSTSQFLPAVGQYITRPYALPGAMQCFTIRED